MKRRLILMRHAKSSWDTNAPDHDRPLADRGKREAPVVGAKLAELGWVPNLVLSSDSRRTRQTWKRMRDAFPEEIAVEYLRSLYLGGIEEVRAELKRLPAAVEVVMLLGHNPGWEEALEWLCGKDKMLTTANAALLTGEGETWREAVKKGSFELEGILRPKEL